MTAELKVGRRSEVGPVIMAPGVVRRTLAWGGRMLVAEVSLSEGSAIASHEHPHEQAGYVAAGRVEFTIDGQSTTLGRGDSYAIPGGVTHSVVALEESVVVDVFSPVREEYK